jgi:hypothetical protein
MCSPNKWTADWQVKDANTGVIVAQGHLNWNTCASGYIYGLYGYYWGWVFSTRAGAGAWIDNNN